VTDDPRPLPLIIKLSATLKDIEDRLADLGEDGTDPDENSK
jgi:hypothetical protein